MIRELILICSSIIVLVMLVLGLLYIRNTPDQVNPPNFVKKTRYIDRLTRLNNKYLKDLPCTDKVCTRYCKQGVCDSYQMQLNKYNKCLECEKDGMCLAGNKCDKCPKSPQSCEEQYGCMDKYTNTWSAPFNPGKNECKTCWVS